MLVVCVCEEITVYL